MRIINLGILAHVDAGKTTLAEQLLYACGELRAPGTVDAGSTRTDWLEVERRRGISVMTSSASLTRGDVLINLIDTPGHMDFTGEVERALVAMDAVVVLVSAAEGVQSQTELFWKAARTLSLPALLFVNKIDRAGCEPEAVLAQLQRELSPAVIPLNRAVKPGSTDCAVEACPLGEEEILTLCENDEALTELYLSGGEIPPARLREALEAQTRAAQVYPLLFGATALGLGVEALLDAVCRLLPCAASKPEGEPAGVVYKIEHSPTMGKIAHVRLYEGTLKNRDSVKLFRPGAEPVTEKVTQIRRVSGGKHEDRGELTGGDIAAVYGLTDVKTGDMLGRRLERVHTHLTTPLFSVQVSGRAGEEAKLLQAVMELSDEDPSMICLWNPDEREITLSIMGKIHLEIIGYLLRERYGIEAVFSPPTVIYKETPLKTGRGLEAYTMPKPCWAVVALEIEPLPRGSGYQYESITPDKNLFYRYQNHVKTTVPEALKQGLLGWEVVDLKVTLIDGQHHTIHTHPMDFFLATPIAVMKALTDCGTQLLEPMVNMRLSAPEELSGKLIGDILGMRGSFDSPVVHHGRMELEARVPVASSLDYAARFASVTSGKGTLRVQFSGYEPCPAELGAVAKRRGLNPLDRAKWILYKRSALSG